MGYILLNDMLYRLACSIASIVCCIAYILYSMYSTFTMQYSTGRSKGNIAIGNQPRMRVMDLPRNQAQIENQ